MDYPATWQNEILMPLKDGEDPEAEIGFELTDKQLAELILAGDEAAFERMFERYKRLAAAVACRFFRRPEQIEEVIQISFTKAYFELAGFQGKHDFSLANWLTRITTNVCLDLLRSRKRKPENLVCELSRQEAEFLIADSVSAGKNAETLLIERDLSEKLLSQLTAEDRAILQMIYEEEMSVHEVAAVTGWSSSKIKVRAYRARIALRKILRRFL